MNPNQKFIPGILGGVGPSATNDLLRKIVIFTPADNDQDHLVMRVSFYPHPDRTKALLEGGSSPVPTLVAEALALQKAGAQFFVIPCNTAHCFLPEIQKAVGAPFINMIKQTGKAIQRLGFSKVGLLSTAGTAKTGIYQETLKAMGIEVVVPSDKNIQKEMEAIYGPQGIKAGVQYERSAQNKGLFKDVIAQLQSQGSQAIMMGCTEIPLCLESRDLSLPLVNPTEILAQAVVDYALGKPLG